MRLIIGGAYQGKYQYAKQAYPDSKIVNGLHEMIRCDVCEKVGKEQPSDNTIDFTKLQGQLEDTWVERMLSLEREEAALCITCDEVGMGIVPMEKWERMYREIVGHVCIRLAEEAESVERVVCGCAEKIK